MSFFFFFFKHCDGLRADAGFFFCMLQFSGFYFGFLFFFPFTEKERKSHPQHCSRWQPGGSGVKGGATGVKPTEFILSEAL